MTDKRRNATVYDRFGQQLVIHGKECCVEEMLAMIYEGAPWAILGHSMELERTWYANRDAVIAQVDHRKSRFMMASA